MTIKPDKRGKNIKLNFICSNKNGNRQNCNNSVISSDIVLNSVLDNIRQECQKIILNKKEVVETFATVEKEINAEKYKIQNDINKTNSKIQRLETQIKAVYDDKLNGVLSVEDFIPIYQAKKEEKEKLINEQKELKKKLEQQEKAKVINYDDLYTFANNFLQMKNPTKEVIADLVDFITIYKGRKIKIKYKFSKV